LATTIAIICTLDELTPYSLSDRTKRYFSLHWSVALRGDAALPPAAAAALFQPWTLSSEAVGHPVPAILPVLYGDSLAAGAVPGGAVVPFQLIDAPPSDASPVGTLLSVEYTAAVKANDIAYFSWPDEPDATRPVGTALSTDVNWSRVLAHASTYTAPLPRSLNLAVHFTVKTSDLTVSGKAITRLFAAPSLQLDAATLLSPSAQPSGVNQGIITYPYASTVGGLAVAAYHPEFVLSTLPVAGPLPKPHFIDLNTYWVGTEDGTDQVTPAESTASEDWRTSLEFKTGDEFDLGQRLIVCLRALFFPKPADTASPVYHPLDAAHPTFNQVNTICDAVLAALHDTADFGLRYGPDGTNLIRYLLQRTTPVFDPVPVENTLLNATTNTLANWKQLIFDQFAIDLTPGVVSDQPAAGDYVRDVLDKLDAVQKALSTDATLAPLLVDQWTSAVTSVDPAQVSTWVAAVKSLIVPTATATEALPSRALRSRMLLGNMGGQEKKGNEPKYPVDQSVPIWTALTDTKSDTTFAAETQTVTANLQALLAAYFQGRFGITSTDPNSKLFANRNPPAPWPGAVDAPLPDLSQALKDDASAFASKVLFPTGIQPSRGSHPIIIQVDDTSDDPTEPVDDARKIAGYGLLLREGTGLWTCPNMANLYVNGLATAFKADVPVPLRLTQRNNLKQPVLIYNSASLVTQDNNEKASSDFPQTQQYPDPDSNDFTQMFSYKADVAQQVKPPTLDPDPANPDGLLLNIPATAPPTGDNLFDWMRIPALKFGSTYTLLPFVIGNGGALPPLLTGNAATDVFTPITPKAFATAWQQAGLKGYLRQVTYKRRGAVGPPRQAVPLVSPQTGTISLPVFPDTVLPLARDLKGTSGAVQPPILMLWGDSATPPAATRSFSFKLRPPSCDLETWDRWVAGLGPTYNNTRIAIATGVGLGSLKNDSGVTILSAQNELAQDLTLDDPAVQSLTVSVTRLYPDPAAAPAVPPVTLLLTPPAALPASIPVMKATIVSSLLSTAQSNKFPFTCAIDTAVSLAPFGTGVRFAVPEGQIWQIDVKPNIPDADVTGKFEGPAADARGATFSLIVEAATAGIFDPKHAADQTAFQQQVWKNLSVSFAAPVWSATQDAVTPAMLSASLNRWDDAATNPARDLIHNVDLRRQQWRWRGRPLPALPPEWSTANPDLDAVPAILPNNTMNSRLWEVALFGERPDDDCSIKTSSVNFAAITSPASAQLFSVNLTGDPRASYERFGVDVHSRYEDLPGLTVAPIRARMLNNGIASAYTRWKRGLVTPRVQGVIPKPKIVLVLPLTGPDGSDPTTLLPGLLAIANEPPFSLGGLAEELHCELDLARDPSYPLSIPTQNANPMPEIGPNPIFTAAVLDSQDFSPGAPVRPADPIGTTFDQSSSSPLYSSTCYRIDAPMVHSDGATPYQGALSAVGLEHYRARVRFRRAIIATSFNAASPDLFSDPTDAFSVEFQPSFDHCLLQGITDPVSFDELKFRVEAGVVKAYRNRAPVTLEAGPPQGASLELWVLVLEQITDATGKKGTQMRALDLLSFPAVSTIVTADSSDHIFYVLEVLCTKGNVGKFASGIGNAANMLFGKSNSDQRLSEDVQARIQRCSRSVGHYAG
jgi:hypothetical protein